MGSQGVPNTDAYVKMVTKEDMRISRSVATESVFLMRNQMNYNTAKKMQVRTAAPVSLSLAAPRARRTSSHARACVRGVSISDPSPWPRPPRHSASPRPRSCA